MRRISLALAIGSLVAVALLCISHAPKSTGTTALYGVSSAYAQDDGEPIPLPKPKPGPGPQPDPACSRVCLVANGVNFCGTGTGRIGCKSIVNNSCIYALCAL